MLWLVPRGYPDNSLNYATVKTYLIWQNVQNKVLTAERCFGLFIHHQYSLAKLVQTNAHELLTETNVTRTHPVNTDHSNKTNSLQIIKRMGLNPNVRVLRGIISEMRRASTGPLKENYMFRYIMDQYRKFNTTERQICRAQEEMQYLASAYSCYLRSSRLQKEISEEFHGKGERTVAETAKMVGFKLPHDPK